MKRGSILRLILVLAMASVAAQFGAGCTFEVGPRGVVLGVDGQPAAGAQVILAAPDHPVTYSDGELRGNQWMKATTGEDGSYAMQWAITPYLIVAATEDGIVLAPQVDHEDGDSVQVKPFGRITGALVKDTDEDGLLLRLGSVNRTPWEPEFAVAMEVEQEEDGSFAIERVPPGLLVLSALESGGDERLRWSMAVEVRPGETTQVDAEASGRSVTGTILFPEEIGRSTLEEQDQALLQGAPEMPEPPEGLDEEEWEKWQEEWAASEEGKAHERHAARSYGLRLDESGAFELKGVAPGRYALQVTLYDEDHETLGELSEMVDVPADGDGPVALGEKSIAARVRMVPGVEAPPFTATALSGGELTLAQYRGKYVFLDFWATWCGPCRAEMPYLKEAYETFKDDERFVLMSLSVDGTIEEPQDYVKENDLKWTHVWLGEWSDTPVPDQYGVEGIPSTFLIGPDGKILEVDLRGEDVIPGIQKHLDAAGDE